MTYKIGHLSYNTAIGGGGGGGGEMMRVDRKRDRLPSEDVIKLCRSTVTVQ